MSVEDKNQSQYQPKQEAIEDEQDYLEEGRKFMAILKEQQGNIKL